MLLNPLAPKAMEIQFTTGGCSLKVDLTMSVKPNHIILDACTLSNNWYSSKYNGCPIFSKGKKTKSVGVTNQRGRGTKKRRWVIKKISPFLTVGCVVSSNPPNFGSLSSFHFLSSRTLLCSLTRD